MNGHMARLVVAAALAGLIVHSVGLKAAQSSADAPREAPASVRTATNIGRMFPVPSKTAWQAVVRWMKQAQIGTESVDNRNQVLLTRWVQADNNRFPVREEFRRDSSTLPRVQLQVFVSPFVEPARMYVTSVVEWSRGQGKTWELRRSYNVAEPSVWLLDALAADLGSVGFAIPADYNARLELGRELNPQTSVCSATASSGFVPPERIAFVQPVYPVAAVAQARNGQVRVSGPLLEDGVFSPNAGSPEQDTDAELRSAALGALTLWRYRPLTVGGCPSIAFLTVTVNFVLR